MVEANFLNPASVLAAMRNIKRTYFTYPVADGLLEAATIFAPAARDAGLELLVNNSQFQGTPGDPVFRDAALPHNRRTFGNWLRQFAQFMIAPSAQALISIATTANYAVRLRRSHWSLNKEEYMLSQLCFFVSIAFSFIACWNRRRPIHLAGTTVPATGPGLAASAHPAQLPLHRAGIPGSGRRVARFAVSLRAFRGLWRHRCGDTRVDFAAMAVTRCGHCPRVGLQYLGRSRSPERFVPGQSSRPLAGAVGSHLLHSDCLGAATTDHARARFSDSSAIWK